MSIREKIAALLTRKPKGEYLARAAFAAAEDNRFREKTWEKALDHDADGDLLPELAKIRKRCRHEIRNNAYAAGIGQTRADYLIGDGPRVQFKTSSEAKNALLEKAFTRWSWKAESSARLSLAGMLRLGEKQTWPCGEYFLIETYKNRRLQYQLIEPDRVSNPAAAMDTDTLREGVEFDPDTGERVAYWVAKRHPYAYAGNLVQSANDWQRIPAERVIHRALLERPGQTRGQPGMAPILNTLADLRRFRNATILSAEISALFSAYMKTQGPMGEDQDVYDAQTVDIQPGTITTLAPGYDIGQIKPEHPANTHKDFMRSILAECGRPAGLPYNVVALDSSNHNYSSGRLDWQAFHRYLKTEREVIERQVLQQIIESFVRFARLTEIDLTEQEAVEAANDWTILWPGMEHVDPNKEASAAIDLIGSDLLTLQDYFAERGHDYREKLMQIATEKKLMSDLKLVPADMTAALSKAIIAAEAAAITGEENAKAIA
jgi:lambda family phage portal protein